MQILQLRSASFRMTTSGRLSFAGSCAKLAGAVAHREYVGILRFAQNDDIVCGHGKAPLLAGLFMFSFDVPLLGFFAIFVGEWFV